MGCLVHECKGQSAWLPLIYIDGALALQGNMHTNDSMKPGVYCANGTARLSDVLFYELEK